VRESEVRSSGHRGLPQITDASTRLPIRQVSIITKLKALKAVAEWTESRMDDEADRHEWREVQLVLDTCVEMLERPGSIK
jgi:hypothetical protein